MMRPTEGRPPGQSYTKPPDVQAPFGDRLWKFLRGSPRQSIFFVGALPKACFNHPDRRANTAEALSHQRPPWVRVPQTKFG